ncbi:hypothetical protein N9770_00005, partial [Amylibacter sp.]|nr:hypothetical protein [Amylibacter sp.]
MKKFIKLILLIGFPSAVFSGEITCWDRNINAAQSAFSSRAAAESWFSEYVYISDDTVQWGVGADSWYEPKYNENDSYKNAKVFYESNVFNYSYRRKTNRLTVVLGIGQNGYKTIPPVIYMTC